MVLYNYFKFPLSLLGIFLLLFGISLQAHAQFAAGNFKFTELKLDIPTGIRAMQVINDSVVWVGGSNGYVGKTMDGGKTWQWMQPAEGKPDFRSLVAFSAQKAVVANAGSPAYIFITTDGGNQWKKVYANADSAVFLDGMVFKNEKEGIVYGDPMDGHFLLLKTTDGGNHWKKQSPKRSPKALSGEASFAASNSAIFNLPHSNFLWIGTGGIHSRIFFSKNFGKRWKAINVPIIQGKSSTGIFSLAFFNKNKGIGVGGDYTADTVRLNNAVLTFDGGKTWQKPIINPYGYRSCVVYFSVDTLLATGTSGTDLSKDGGHTWRPISGEGYNIIGISPSGHRKVYLAGPNGKMAQLEFSTKYKGKIGSVLKATE